MKLAIRGLNPCFNGRYSQRDLKMLKEAESEVLILVLMEDTLRVLIVPQESIMRRLNPCFNGRYSQSFCRF